MKTQIHSLAGLAAAALLVVAVGAACGRPGDRVPAGGAPAASQAATTGPDATAPATPNDANPASAQPQATDQATDQASVQSPDPLDGELNDLNSLINGINSSLSGDGAGNE